MKATKQIDEAIERILKTDAVEFIELVKIAGLDPSKDFRFTNLSGVNFAGSDLAGFDFTGALIEGARFHDARISGAIFENAIGGESELRYASDWKDYKRDRQIADSFDLFDEMGDLLPHIYMEHFASYRWTYIAGYQNLVELLFLSTKNFTSNRDATRHIAAHRFRAKDMIPDGWKARFPDGNWNSISSAQIEGASNGAALRFDKACVAIKALEIVFAEAAEAALRDIDVYEFLALRPAVFVLRNLDDEARAFLYGDNLNAAEQRLCDDLISQLRPRDNHGVDLGWARILLTEVAQGFGITFQSATVIAKFLHQIGFSKPAVVALESRMVGSGWKREKRCSSSERAFLSVAPPKMSKLWKLAH
jgi:hypothetical protein